jgi:muramidase (phage lysozyme)
MTLSAEGLKAALDYPNVLAFLRVIRERESGQGADAYTIINGGEHVTDLSRHPFHGIPTTQGGRAAGAYQFLGTTWARLCEQYEFADFAPATQDLGAIALLQGRGALQDVIAGRFEQACIKCRKEWTSLPGAAESSASWTMDKARAVFVNYGGRVDNGELLEQPEPAPITEIDLSDVPPRVEPQPETRMPILALLAAFGPVLAQLIPPIAAALDHKSATPAKLDAAGKILEIVTTAAGATNVQQAVEKLQASPELVKTVTDAIVTAPEVQPYLTIVEVGGGVQKAREVASDPNALPYWKQGAFAMGVILVPLVYMVTYRVLWGEEYSEQLRTVVVTAILSGLLGALTGFFFGSMFTSSKRATDTGAKA